MGLLNISFTWPIHALDEIDISSRREWSKKSALSPAQTQGRQDALFHGHGRSHFGARSVLSVREHGTMARTPLAAFFNIPLMVEKRWVVPKDSRGFFRIPYYPEMETWQIRRNR
ncbi:MAG: hypothetical protein VST68_00870 [Nitrospirota bacterium]|nr:hypothetical protein [Nitrospirota bacterium]